MATPRGLPSSPVQHGTASGDHNGLLSAPSWRTIISKTEGALQELEETTYWLELLAASGIVNAELLTDLMKEADELTAILVTSVKTIKNRRK